jgi:glutamate carboxypeptidase
MDEALTWLRGQRPEMERWLRALVEASSHTADKRGVDAASAVLREVVGIGCEVVPSARFGDHLFFHNERAAGGRGAVLVGHIDTVFSRESFAGYRVEGDRARGPGVLDMKGGLVVVGFALEAMRRAGLLEGLPLTFAVVSDEEVGSPESYALLREVARGASCALVFEAGRAGDAIVTRRKGTGAVTVHARGRAAHAGNAHREGANALWSLARWIDRAQGLTDYDRGVTVNVGRVEGGIGKNTVPDRARAEVDFRYASRADAEALMASLRALARDAAVEGTAIELEGGVARSSLERTDESAALCARYAACQRAAGLGDGECPLQGGGSDAATTADAGVPSIDGLGPRGEGFHTLREYADLASLVPKAEALVRFLCGLREGAVVTG